MSLCVSVCPSRSLLSCIKSVWKAGGIVRTVSAMACYIPSFKKFHARVHAISRNFTQFSRNFGYFSHFWANFYMLGIKKHVLKLRNSLVILSCNFRHVFTQFHAYFMQFLRNLVYFPFLGEFQHVNKNISMLMLGIWSWQIGFLDTISEILIVSNTLTHSHTIFTNFSRFWLF